MMDKHENRAVIKYLWLKGLKPVEIFKEMRSVLGEESAPSCTTVKNWVTEFKRGRTSVADEKRSGGPKRVTTFENIAKVQKLVEGDPQLKVADIANVIGLSKERAYNILVKELGLRKTTNGWERNKQLAEGLTEKKMDEENQEEKGQTMTETSKRRRMENKSEVLDEKELKLK